MKYYIKQYKSIFIILAIILNFNSINYAVAATTLANQVISPTVMTSGKASWYAYKGGLFAASPDFSIGTKLKVTSVNNPDKSIIVTVNDYGPNRAIHPDRVIDLDKVAFAKLAPVGAGVIDVLVEPVDSSILKSEVIPTETLISSISTTTNELMLNEDLSRETVLTSSVLPNFSNGELWQNSKTGGVYYVSDAGKQALTDRIFLQTLFQGKKIIQKTPTALDKLTTKAPVVFPNGYLIKNVKNPTVYLIFNNEKRAFSSGEVFEKLGYKWNNIVVVPDKIVNQYTTNQAIQNSNIKNKEVKESSEEIVLTSKSAIVMNVADGKIIYSKNASEQLPLASLSKLVAMKVFLDTKPNLNQVVTYKVADENYNYKYADKSVLARLRVSDGETMTIRDLLYSSILGSANNAVETLVRVSSLSREAFIARMNQYVKDLGATQTKFEEPTGLSPENVTSALDFSLITRALLKDGHLEKVSMTKNYSFTTVNKKIPHNIKNSNSLFFTSNLQITASKTGYLDEALYCLMTRAKDSQGHEVIAITLGTPNRATSFKETESLIKYGLQSGI